MDKFEDESTYSLKAGRLSKLPRRSSARACDESEEHPGCRVEVYGVRPIVGTGKSCSRVGWSVICGFVELDMMRTEELTKRGEEWSF